VEVSADDCVVVCGEALGLISSCATAAAAPTVATQPVRKITANGFMAQTSM
jgi:hypothetical protein